MVCCAVLYFKGRGHTSPNNIKVNFNGGFFFTNKSYKNVNIYI